MNKNPFAVASAYTPQQPPLPPGPPPPQPTQHDYTAYWAAAAAAQQAQQPGVAAYNPQWSQAQPAQPPPRPPPEQSALYANYGYGGQPNLSWQQQQQRQQPPFQPPPPVVQPPPQPPQPAYNPYQPQAGVYQQPYVPQVTPPQPVATQAPYQAQVPAPPPFQQPQQFFPQQQQQNRQHNRPPNAHHASPQHLPPAKRQRFDGPNQHRGPPQPQFQAPPPPPAPQGQGAPLGGGVGVGMYNLNQGPSHGHGRGGPPGANQVPLGGNRGGFSGGGGSGRGGNMSGGRGRGGSMSMNRGGSRGRGGGMYNNMGGRGGGPMQSSGSMRGHGGSNRAFSNRENRRGGSFNSGGGQGFSHGHQTQQQHHHQQGFSGSTSFRSRNQNFGGNRNRHDSGVPHGPRESGSSSNFSSGKKDENRRTLTDFKIIGLEIADLSWSWGVLPKEDHAPEVKPEVSDAQSTSTGQADNKVVEQNGPAESTTTASTSDADESATKSEVPAPADSNAKAETSNPAMPPPPSRIRIYFHTPVSADDSHPIPSQNAYAAASDSSMRKGKRKKLDDDDGDVEDGRGPPPPPPGLDHDSSSVAPTVDVDGSETAVGRGSVAPSVAESASEADWLMAAIGEDEADNEVEAGDHTQNDEAEVHHDDDADAIGEDYVEGDVYDDIHDDSHIGVGLDETHIPPPDGEHGENNTHHENGIVPTLGPNDPQNPSPHDSHSLPEFHAPSQVSPSHADESSAPGQSVSSSTHHDSDSAAQRANTTNGDEVNGDPHNTDIQANDSQSPSRAAPLQASESVASIATEPDEDPTFSPYASTVLNDEGQPPMGILATQDTTALFGDSTPKQDDEQTEDGTQPSAPPSNAGTTITHPIPPKPVTSGEKTPSANRLSISYAAGAKRMVIDAEIVDSIRVFRSEGRIEVHMNICKLDTRFKGILVEAISDSATTYSPLDLIHASPEDTTVPPFNQAQTPCKCVLIAHLDREKPLSEPRWVKTGDVQEWLKSMFGRMFWVAGDAADGWEKKIEVVDPDPPPTIWTVLEAWSNNSSVGVQIERQRFLRTHMTETDNILEILLRLVRGERASYSQSTPIISAPSVSGPLLSALSQGSAHGAQQTHVSLAVLAIFRLAVEFAKKAVGDGGKGEVEERVGEIIRCLPSHLLYKSLDGIFKEWRVEKKGGR